MSVFRFLADLSVGGISLLIYLVAVILIHPTAVYAGGWPIFLFYIFVFASVFFLRIRIQVSVGFVVAIIASVTFSLMILHFGNVTAPGLFANGMPTVLGVVLQLAVSAIAVVLAVAASAIIRAAFAKLEVQFPLNPER